MTTEITGRERSPSIAERKALLFGSSEQAVASTAGCAKKVSQAFRQALPSPQQLSNNKGRMRSGSELPTRTVQALGTGEINSRVVRAGRVIEAGDEDIKKVEPPPRPPRPERPLPPVPVGGRLRSQSELPARTQQALVEGGINSQVQENRKWTQARGSSEDAAPAVLAEPPKAQPDLSARKVEGPKESDSFLKEEWIGNFSFLVNNWKELTRGYGVAIRERSSSSGAWGEIIYLRIAPDCYQHLKPAILVAYRLNSEFTNVKEYPELEKLALADDYSASCRIQEKDLSKCFPISAVSMEKKLLQLKCLTKNEWPEKKLSHFFGQYMSAVPLFKEDWPKGR